MEKIIKNKEDLLKAAEEASAVFLYGLFGRHRPSSTAFRLWVEVDKKNCVETIKEYLTSCSELRIIAHTTDQGRDLWIGRD